MYAAERYVSILATNPNPVPNPNPNSNSRKETAAKAVVGSILGVLQARKIQQSGAPRSNALHSCVHLSFFHLSGGVGTRFAGRLAGGNTLVRPNAVAVRRRAGITGRDGAVGDLPVT